MWPGNFFKQAKMGILVNRSGWSVWLFVNLLVEERERERERESEHRRGEVINSVQATNVVIIDHLQPTTVPLHHPAIAAGFAPIDRLHRVITPLTILLLLPLPPLAKARRSRPASHHTLSQPVLVCRSMDLYVVVRHQPDPTRPPCQPFFWKLWSVAKTRDSSPSLPHSLHCVCTLLLINHRRSQWCIGIGKRKKQTKLHSPPTWTEIDDLRCLAEKVNMFVPFVGGRSRGSK